VGKDLSDVAWRGVARQLVARGALDVAVENHGELVPTDAAKPILKGEQQVMLREDLVQPGGRSTPASRAARASGTAAPVGDAVFEALRDWRRGEAQAQSVPAYVIFQDRTLAEIAAQKPRSLNQLGQIAGVGRTKLDRYGTAVLKVLAG
jgi:ATP-dependent DNA helicase RecQ